MNRTSLSEICREWWILNINTTESCQHHFIREFSLAIFFFQRRNSMKISITQVMPLCTQILLPWWRTKIQRIPSALFCCTKQHDCIPWTSHSRINSILSIQPISSSLENLGQVQLSLVKKKHRKLVRILAKYTSFSVKFSSNICNHSDLRFVLILFFVKEISKALVMNLHFH